MRFLSCSCICNNKLQFKNSPILSVSITIKKRMVDAVMCECLHDVEQMRIAIAAASVQII